MCCNHRNRASIRRNKCKCCLLRFSQNQITMKQTHWERARGWGKDNWSDFTENWCLIERCSLVIFFFSLFTLLLYLFFCGPLSRYVQYHEICRTRKQYQQQSHSNIFFFICSTLSKPIPQYRHAVYWFGFQFHVPLRWKLKKLYQSLKSPNNCFAHENCSNKTKHCNEVIFWPFLFRVNFKRTSFSNFFVHTFIYIYIFFSFAFI